MTGRYSDAECNLKILCKFDEILNNLQLLNVIMLIVSLYCFHTLFFKCRLTLLKLQYS